MTGVSEVVRGGRGRRAPPAVVTVMSTVPVPAGDVAVIDVAELTVKLAAAVLPNFTAVAPVKLVPVMVTEVPPEFRPDPGLTAVTVGAETAGVFSTAPIFTTAELLKARMSPR